VLLVFFLAEKRSHLLGQLVWCAFAFFQRRKEYLGCRSLDSRVSGALWVYLCFSMLVDWYPLLLIAYSYWSE
jgi:hypothetical protein